MVVNNKSVVVQPKAFVTIVLHATQYPYDSVHGILLGRRNETTTLIDAVPVSHGAPSKPIVEMALGLVEANSDRDVEVVGWYTAPKLKDDTQAGPVALRMVASLATSPANNNPVLVVVQNDALGNLMKKEEGAAAQNDSAPDVLNAYGKNSGGNQWLDNLNLTLEDSRKSAMASREASLQQIKLIDFVDHLDNNDPSSCSSWYPNQSISKVVNKC